MTLKIMNSGKSIYSIESWRCSDGDILDSVVLIYLISMAAFA